MGQTYENHFNSIILKDIQYVSNHRVQSNLTFVQLNQISLKKIPKVEFAPING